MCAKNGAKFERSTSLDVYENFLLNLHLGALRNFISYLGLDAKNGCVIRTRLNEPYLFLFLANIFFSAEAASAPQTHFRTFPFHQT